MVEVDTTQREARAREVRHVVVARIAVATHRTFGVLFAAQAAAALLLAWRNLPLGESRMALTLVLSGMLSVPAMLFARAAPLEPWVRHFVGVCQIGWSMLFVWLFNGAVESYFHLFASLALLTYYRDRGVLISATLAAVAGPAARLVLMPEPYLAGAAAWWRIADQGAWVVGECALLLFATHQNLRSLRKFYEHAATLQLTNEAIARDAQLRTAELERSREQYRQIAEHTRAVPFELDLAHGRFSYVGPQAQIVLGFPAAQWSSPGFLDVLLPREREGDMRRQLDECTPGNFEALCSVVTPEDRVVELRWTVACELRDEMRFLRGLMIDVSESRRMEREMAQGQKLESVGRVAAGVAHEINTSVQFISDSVRFVRHALKDVPRALAAYRALVAAVLSGRDATEAARLASDTDEAADVDYFLKNAPDALDRGLEGIGRVGSIVRSMTEFTHPGANTQTDVDLNRTILNTLNMARNEYRSVADVDTVLGDIPPVRCHAGDVNQVVLNLVLNAAHAIGDVVRGTARRGRITVGTRALAGYVEISIADTGDGIPESVRARIFEPFVTTKEVGRGTGQGLALSRGIVVEKLKGSLHFETETGKGTTFFIRLPVSETAASADSTNKQAAA